MKKGEISVSKASVEDIQDIEKFAKNLNLDCEDLNYMDFIKAKRDNSIIGFGRLRRYSNCTELATLGVLPEERKNGIGSMIVTKLIDDGPQDIYITCVIPDFFKRFGFIQVNKYPEILKKKIDFCKCYDYKDDEVFVMKLTKKISNHKNMFPLQKIL